MGFDRRNLLTVAGVIAAGISALHVACAIIGPAAYRYFGAGEQLASLAASGSPIPAVVTILLALLFGLFAAYALSGAGRVRPLPFLRQVVGVIGAVFALRGLLLLLELATLVRRPSSVPLRGLVFSAVALVVGALYLVGAFGRGAAHSSGDLET
jgi:hypothetical protein